jgi:hypothetical protein
MVSTKYLQGIVSDSLPIPAAAACHIVGKEFGEFLVPPYKVVSKFQILYGVSCVKVWGGMTKQMFRESKVFQFNLMLLNNHGIMMILIF